MPTIYPSTFTKLYNNVFCLLFHFRLNKGIPVDLDAEEFTIHECASTLKNFLSDLPEPLLTDAYYRGMKLIYLVSGLV